MLDDDNNNNNDTNNNDGHNKNLVDAIQPQQYPRAVVPIPIAESKSEQIAASGNPVAASSHPMLAPTLLPAHSPAAPVPISLSKLPAAGDNDNRKNGGGGYGNAFRCPPASATPAASMEVAPQANSKKAATPAARRSGRPPNINENSLQRRLECVLAVEDGMNMADACAAYEISTRTFYRWLRSKPKLVELTSAAGSKSPTPNSPPVNPVNPVHPAHRPAKRTRHAAAAQSRYKPVDERTRIEVVHPTDPDTNITKNVTIALNWYPDTAGSDIREAIRRRFGIKEGVDWGVNGADSEEVIVSPGMPSGKYSLFFTNRE